MSSPLNPYDELPYRCFPVEWTAPERLAMASLLHGGPRPPLDSFRVLELGCGNGANLLPMAYYRPHASFVGVDGALSQVEAANARKSALALSNIDFVHADFRAAARRLSGQFDYIIAHGIFSWVPHEARDALLELCAERLCCGGLLYLNYNARPGWDVRGLIRNFLLAQTAGGTGLADRARLAQIVAGKVVPALSGCNHHYSQLLANEFRFVHEGDITWVAHEFLSSENYSYWRSEFFELAHCHGLEYVADADFNYRSRQMPDKLAPWLEAEHITGRSIDDTVDLLCFRQLHSPILTPGPLTRRMPRPAEFGNLIVASCLEVCSPADGSASPTFKHPSGYEVEARKEFMRTALTELRGLWPRGVLVKTLFPDTREVEEDLRLLQRNELIELRCVEPGDWGISGDLLNKLEHEWDRYLTTPYHRTERTPA